jgi:hypothetical protein
VGKELEQIFSKEDVQIMNRHMKRWSVPLIIQELQIKATMGYCFTPSRMATIQTQNITSVDEGV